MNISSVDTIGAGVGAMQGVSAAVSVPENGKATASSSPAQTTNGNTGAEYAQVKQMVEEMQSNLDSMNVSLQYSLYGAHDSRIAVQVVNKGTGEVIREIPAKEMQALQAKMSDLVGMIFNGKG